jgi:DNA-binding YbaB/EbfC family protein
MGKGMKAGKRKPPGGGAKGMNNQAEQMRHLQAMQSRMDEMQAELETKEAEATAGGGAVAVKVNGKKELVSVKIDPEVMDRDDPEMLQDLIIVAVNEAMRQIEEISQAEMEKVTGGMNLPF